MISKKTALALCLLPVLLFSQEKHCLWQVQHGESTVYLAGSVHAMSDAQYPLPAVFDQAFESSPELFFELNMDSAATPAAMALMMQKIQLPEGKTLQTVLGDSVWQRAKQAGTTLGLDLDAMSRQQPWSVASVMMMAGLNRQGVNPMNGLDVYFHNRAKSAGKDINGLETLAFQLDLFSGLADSLQASFMTQTLDEMDVLSTEFNRLLSHWSKGRADSLEAMLLQGFIEDPDFKEAFLVKRNQTWLPVVIDLLEKGRKAMVVVGAAHLVGEDGLVQLLEEAGYTVQQL